MSERTEEHPLVPYDIQYNADYWVYAAWINPGSPDSIDEYLEAFLSKRSVSHIANLDLHRPIMQMPPEPGLLAVRIMYKPGTLKADLKSEINEAMRIYDAMQARKD